MSKITINRQQEVELPRTVDVVFINKNADYQQGSQKSSRLTGASQDTATVTLPIVMTDGQAKNIAEKLLYSSWVERNKFSFKLPRKYLYLEPTDVITFVDESNGTTHTIRITRKVESRTGAIEFEGVSDEASVYTQDVETGDANSVAQELDIDGPSKVIMLDTALLRDSDDPYSMYAGMSGFTSGWPGGVLFKSPDAGSTYNQVSAFLESSVIGTATTALGDFTDNMFDEKNTVTVTVYSGELFSVSELQVLNGANAAYLGGEIIQFKNAVLNADGSYTLSGLLRGRKGTEWMTSKHQIGETFCYLNDNVFQLKAASSELNQERLYKAVTIGATLATAAVTRKINRGNALRPYAPVQPSGGKQSNGDWLINWVRRARKNHQWSDNVDVALGEDTESYEIEIVSTEKNITVVSMTNGTLTFTCSSHGYVVGDVVHIWDLLGLTEFSDSTVTISAVPDTSRFSINIDTTGLTRYTSGGKVAKVLRTLTSTTQTVTYTAAEQVTDFGTGQSTLTAYIYQLSQQIGRGRMLRWNR